MFPVSVWILKIDLKQTRNELVGGRWPVWRKSLSWSQSGRERWWTTLQPAAQTFFTNSSACSAALHVPDKKSSTLEWRDTFRSSSSPSSSGFPLILLYKVSKFRVIQFWSVDTKLLKYINQINFLHSLVWRYFQQICLCNDQNID